MILTGPEIRNAHADGRVRIDPYLPELVNPNSYNVRLGRDLVLYDEPILDPRRPNRTRTLTIPDHGLELRPDRVYLGATVERIGSDCYVPILHGRSSTGRLGLFVEVTASIIDIGSYGCLTLQLVAVQPLRVYAGMRIGQVMFITAFGEIELYAGKYQGSTGPRASEIWRDFSAAS